MTINSSLKKIKSIFERKCRALKKIKPLWLRRLVQAIYWHAPIWLVSLYKPSLKLNAYYCRCLERPVDDSLIFYESFQGRAAGDSPLAMLAYFLENPEYDNFNHVYFFSGDPEKSPLAPFVKHPRVKIIQKRNKQYYKYLATARFLINNNTFYPNFVKREEQTYVNTWHGTPLKALGKDVLGDNLGMYSNAQRNFYAADYLVCPNSYTAEHMIQAYDIGSSYTGKFAETGYPRTDLTLCGDRDKIRADMGIRDDECLILYVPTWRDTPKRYSTAFNNIDEVIINIERIMNRLPPKYVLRARVHHMQKDMLKKRNLDCLAPDTVDTNALLVAADILITDYSSVFFDFLPRRKPILFFTYDSEKYLINRGTYMDLEELPGPQLKSIEEVIDALYNLDSIEKQYHSKYNDFLSRFCSYDDGSACARIAGLMFNGTLSGNVGKVYSLSNAQKKILYFPGPMKTNGITSAAISFTRNLDYENYELYVFIDSRQFPSNIKRIDERAKIIFMQRPAIFRDSRDRKAYYNFFVRPKPKKPTKLMQYSFFDREKTRVLGNCDYDYVISFEGYSRYEAALFTKIPAKKRLIFLHSNMVGEYNTRNKGLLSIFSTYDYYDRLLAVSKDSMQQNREQLVSFIEKETVDKIFYMPNILDGEHIKRCLETGNLVYIQGKAFYLYSNKDTDEINEICELGLNPANVKLVKVPDSAGRTFITLGRLSPEKNQSILIEAFRDVVDKYPNSILYICGEGPLEKTLRDKISGLELTENVIILGLVKNPFPLLSRCDCFVLPSLYEGFGLVILESMVLGIPVIVNDIPGPATLIDKYGGVKISDINEESLKDAMIDFIKNGLPKPKFNFDLLEQLNAQNMQMFYDVLADSSEGERLYPGQL